MAVSLPEAIVRERLLLVEGLDEEHFYETLVAYKGLSEAIQVICVGGKDKFRDVFPKLCKVTGFNQVRVIGFIRDAEGNPAKAAFDSICGVLDKSEFDQPQEITKFSEGIPASKVFIHPDNKSTGMLEDIFLSCNADHPAMKCVDLFVDCAGSLEEPPNNLSKTAAQALMAALPFDALRIGHVVQRTDFWDWDKPELEKIRLFVDTIADYNP